MHALLYSVDGYSSPGIRCGSLKELLVDSGGGGGAP